MNGKRKRRTVVPAASLDVCDAAREIALHIDEAITMAIAAAREEAVAEAAMAVAAANEKRVAEAIAEATQGERDRCIGIVDRCFPKSRDRADALRWLKNGSYPPG